MINFTQRDTIPNLIAAITTLPESTSSAPADFVAAGKALAIARLQAITVGPAINAANVSLRINQIGQFQQFELQLSAQYIKPAPAPAPVAALIALLFLLCGLSAGAQTFGGPLQLTTGSTNAPVYPAATNYAQLTLPSKTLTVYTINTNETLVVSYGVMLPGQTVPVAVVSSTNTFPASAGYTNGQTVTLSFTPPAISLPLVQWMMVTNGTPGTYTNGLYTP
jgi:hypothetical protein